MQKKRFTARAGTRPLVIVTAANDQFVLPLAVMVRSMMMSSKATQKLSLYVLDGGIKAHHRRELLASWDLSRLEVQWLKPPMKRLHGVPEIPWYGLSIYFRLLAPELLPRGLRQALYLDADTVVLDDIGRLWRKGLKGRPLGAVQDAGFMVTEDVAMPYDGGEVPLSMKYFNSGVLLMDLARWRQEKFADRVLDYLRTYGDDASYPDQDALNAVFAGNWRELPIRWNVNLHGCYDRFSTLSARDRDAFCEAITRPAILHFLGGPKPWEKGCCHHRAFLFNYYLDRTRWAGWRPE